MRTTGFALLALCALAACSTETIITHPAEGSGTSSENGGDDTSTDVDPNQPAPGEDGNTDPAAPRAPIVAGLTVKDVAVYQGVKILVVKDGKWVSTRNAPVVAGRPALVRVFVTPDSSWSGKSVTAELRLESGSTKHPLLKDTKTISAASTDTDTKSTFNFEVPAELLTKDVTFSVALTDPKGDDPAQSSPGQFPSDGSQKTLAAQVGGAVKIVVVPVKYDTDGSGRMPDVSQAQLELYKQTVMSMYPTSDVQITVHAPYSWTSTIAGNGAGWDTVLRGITELRQKERPASDVYYYGVFAPKSSFSSFCQGGCVTGLSTVVSNPSTSYLRASVGVGFVGQDSANTMAHEVGHAHGREHAPCGGAQGVDPDYPYSGATIGVWGYDIFTKAFISPTKGHDIMGYCPNEWVSDYTYSALFDRIASISIPTTTKSGTSGSSFQARIATVAADGTVSLDGAEDITLDEAPTDGIAVEGAAGARYYKFDHLPGGFLVLPKSAITTSIKRLDVTGIRATIAR